MDSSTSCWAVIEKALPDEEICPHAKVATVLSQETMLFLWGTTTEFCGARASTNDVCSFNCDCITVPSCKDHNNEKSGRDRAIVTAMIRGVDQMHKTGRLLQPLSANVQQAIAVLEQNYGQANRELTLQSYLIDPPDNLDVALPFFKSSVQMQTWAIQLTAALVWSILGYYDPASRWNDAWSWSPHYVPTAGPKPLEDAAQRALRDMYVKNRIEQLSTWYSGWSSKPTSYPADIYHFMLCFVPKPEDWDGRGVIFKHQFYNSTIWYVWFETSAQVKSILMDAVKATTKN